MKAITNGCFKIISLIFSYLQIYEDVNKLFLTINANVFVLERSLKYICENNQYGEAKEISRLI